MKLLIKNNNYIIKDGEEVKERGSITNNNLNNNFICNYVNYSSLQELRESDELKKDARKTLKYSASLPLLYTENEFSVYSDGYNYAIAKNGILLEKGVVSLIGTVLIPKMVIGAVPQEIVKKTVDFLKNNNGIKLKAYKGKLQRSDMKC